MAELGFLAGRWCACCAEVAFGAEPYDGFAGGGGFGAFLAGVGGGRAAEGSIRPGAYGDGGGEGVQAELVWLIDWLGLLVGYSML